MMSTDLSAHFMDNYQVEALRTANMEDMDIELYAALGLAGEAGEYVDMIKHKRFHGWLKDAYTGINTPDILMEELGDVLWYVAVAAHGHGWKLSDVARSNVAKLRMRYPDGFDKKRSQNRVAGS